MQLGWIDFSPSDREKALGVLDLLSDHDQEHDPLGISSVERAFASFFFPGISTQLTRAKYFILVPCQMIWLYEDFGGTDEKNINKKIAEINKMIAEMEKAYTKVLLENAPKNDTGITGIIGNNSCNGDGWVTRPPSSRYWTSLKKYQILKKDITIKESVCGKSKKNKTDDSEAGGEAGESKIPTPGWTEYWYLDDELKKFYSKFYSEWYNSKPDENSDTELTQWYKEVSIKLTTNEGAFLKNQIIDSYPCSLLAKILDNKASVLAKIFENKTSVSKFADSKFAGSKFADLKGFIDEQYSPNDEIRKRYYLALAFSNFIIVARTLYNIIINEDKPVNKDKPAEDKLLAKKSMSARAKNINIDVLLEKAEISDGSLKEFLVKLQEAMRDGNIEKMKELIKKREKEVVGVAHAKTTKAGEIEKRWYGGKELEYRFNIAKNIINDIFESEGKENAGS